LTCFQVCLLKPMTWSHLIPSHPIRVTESSRNYNYNPSPMKPEGLRRPPSKASMHQSRRLMASAQSNPDVSDLHKLYLTHPCASKEIWNSLTFTTITVRSFLASLVLTSYLVLFYALYNPLFSGSTGVWT
jgi:hypothetical protein